MTKEKGIKNIRVKYIVEGSHPITKEWLEMGRFVTIDEITIFLDLTYMQVRDLVAGDFNTNNLYRFYRILKIKKENKIEKKKKLKKMKENSEEIKLVENKTEEIPTTN